MTIASEISEIEYAGDGVSTVFDISFEFDTAADLKVIETTDGNPVVVTTGFSITGGGGSTGTLTRDTALPVGTNLKIIDDPELTQPVDYIDNDAFPAEVHESALDRLTRICKRLSGRLALTARVPDGDPAGGNSMVFPTVAARRGMLAAWADSATAQLEPLLTLPPGTALSQSIIAALLFPQTSDESSAGVTPTNLQIPSHDVTGTVIVNRYGNNTTPGTTSMQAALDSAKLVSQQSGCPIELLGETYLGTLSLRFNNAGVIGQGSRYSTLKNPAGALSTGGVVEVGDTASGNGATAYEGFVARGFTIDGNRAAATAPVNDLRGHGIILTKITHWRITDVIAKNCHNGGVTPAINSNYGHVECTVENCGNATFTQPGFDINSSKFITGSVISKDCYNGARVLDNCWGDELDITVYNATTFGFVYNNQTVNFSYNNILRVSVYTCGGIGVYVGPNCSNSHIAATVYDATGNGLQIGGNASFPTYGNTILLNTQNGDACGLYVDVGADDNHFTVNTVLDGRAGAQGTSFALDVSGNRNKFAVNLRDSSTWQVRGIAVRAAGSDNEILAYTYTNTADPWNDAGTRTKANHGHGFGSSVASSATVTLPLFGGDKFVISGNTGCTAMTAASNNGREVTLLFTGTPTWTDGGNLKLNGNFVATADDVLRLVCDGTNWYEVSRSAN